MHFVAYLFGVLALLLRLEPGRHRAAAPQRARGYAPAGAPAPEPAAAAPRPAVTRRDTVPHYDGLLAVHAAHRGVWSLQYDPDAGPAPFLATHLVYPDVTIAASGPRLLDDVLRSVDLPARARPYVDPRTDAEHRAAELAAAAALVREGAA